MKKLAVIKSERGLKMVTNLIAKKVSNKIAFADSYHVEVEEYLKGRINHVVIKADHHMLFKCVIDSIWEVVDEYEAKYDSHFICALITTRPYLTTDGKDWLHMPVVEIGVRIKDEK